MQGVIQHEAGDATDVARVEELPDPPAPKAGEVQVRISFSPVHRGDLSGMEAALPDGSATRRLGTEGAGVIAAVGESVQGLEVGDRVAVFPAPGAWAERVNVRAEAAVRVPDSVDDTVASVLLVNTITSRDVLRAIEAARIEAGAADDAPLVVTAAASAVGKLIVRQAIDRGWPVVAVARSDRSTATVREHFPDVPVVTSGNDGWQSELRAALDGRPVPVVTDAHGGPFVQQLLPFLTEAGTVVVWGDLAREPWTLSTMELLGRELRIHGVSIGRWMTRPEDIQAADRQAAVTLAAEHPQLLSVHASYPLDELGSAVTAARENGVGTALLDLR